MDESEDNMSAEDMSCQDSLLVVRTRPKKRSLVERELETNLTARVTSPISNMVASSTSRYGRARKFKTDSEFVADPVKIASKAMKSPSIEKTPNKIQSPAYKMHASNSPIKQESQKCTPTKRISLESNLDNQIENIYHENISLSRFGSDEKKSLSPGTKTPKVYVRKDLIQKRNQDEEETMSLIKNMFSPVKSSQKSKSHLSNILERSSEKYNLNTGHTKSQNGYSSVVKTLDFDSKKKKENRDTKAVMSKSDLFDVEAKCEYQVGDLAWARMGTYPFWPCIVTREPLSGMFVKKKLFGRVEHDIIHVTFFGDNGRRSWIFDNLLRKFLGQLEFEATRERFTPADKKRDPRFYAAFFISEKKQPQWNISVEEAEMLLREPKRLRIDILYDMIHKARAAKTTPKQQQHKSGKITRTGSDVSLSESLYDTLFSEDDGKAEDTDRSRNKSRNKSLDVSEVVTACLDNMAAKTGITKIQRQSHMDRWLQKAKSKTPEKSQAKAQAVFQKVEKETKTTSSKKKKRTPPKPVISKKPYSFRKYANESQNLSTRNFEHDYDTHFVPKLNSTLNDVDNNGSLNDIECIEELQSGIGIISKVESLKDGINSSIKEYVPKIDDCSQNQIIEENDTTHNENTSSTFLSENIETEKGNIIYDIEIKVDELSVQDENQSKNYESRLSAQEKLSDHFLGQTLSSDIENHGTVEKSNENCCIEKLQINEEIVNQCTEKVNQTKLDKIQEYNINSKPCTKPDIEMTMTSVKVTDNTEMPTAEDMDVSLNKEIDTRQIKSNECNEITEEVKQTKFVNKREKHNEAHPKTDIDMDKSTEKPTAEDMEVFLNKEKVMRQIKTNDDTEKNKQTRLIDRQEQHNEAHPKTDIGTVKTKKYVNENTQISIEKGMEIDECSLNEKNCMTEVALRDNTEMSIDIEQDQKVTDDDCDSIVNSINALIEDNLENKILIEHIPGKLDTNKIVSDADHSEPLDVCEDVIENRSHGIDMKNVQEESSKLNCFETVNASVTKIEHEIVSDTDQSESSKIYEGTKGNRSGRTENQNVQSKSMTISLLNTESEIITKDDQSELSEVYRDITGNSSDVLNENIQEKNSESLCFKQSKNVTDLMNSCSHKDTCSTHTESLFEASKQQTTKNARYSNNSNDLNKKTDLELENIKMTKDLRNSRIHYVAFKELAKPHEEELFAHLPEIEILTTEVSKNNKNAVDQQLHTDIIQTTEGKCKPMENDIQGGFPEDKLVHQTDNIVNVTKDRILTNCSLDKEVDKYTIANRGYKSQSEPTVVNAEDKLPNEDNSKDLFLTEHIVGATVVQDLSNCILEKEVDKCTFADNYKSHSDPTADSVDTSKKLTSDPIIINGFHTPKGLEDLEGDTSSINSEDIEPLSVTRNKMLKEKVKPKFEDSEFVTYLEMRQDDLIADHPELNQNEIVEYLYKTWKYEENAKSDIRKNDDIKQINLVKGLESKQEFTKKRSTKEKKQITKERKKRNAVDSDFDTASVKSGDSGTSMKRWLRPKKSALYNEILFDDSRGTTPEIIKIETDIDTVSLCSIESELSIQTPSNEIELVQDVPISSNLEISVENNPVPDSVDLKNIETSKTTDAITTKSTSPSKVNGFKENDDTGKPIKIEFDETASINSASSEVSTSKRKQKSKYVDKTGPSVDDPEFVKYLELRQDTLMDENPQLTHDEIVGYLYKTWLYEESVKSDIKKTDEIEQSNLVKGLNPDQEIQRKKIKKKIKVEKDLKDFIVQDDAIKEKPKRKIAQSNYYKEDFSDIEDEIQIFEITKGKPVPKVQLTRLPEPLKSDDSEVIEIADEVDEVELYFEQLVKPKPNLFKGLIREKVCEICEKTVHLVKCKGCNGMFHINCVKKETKVVETIPLPPKYKKKKKKKLDRKVKSLEDSESHSDEKSRDVSGEFDVSIQRPLQAIDAENFEAQLEAKMKELLESNQAEVHYDSYSSDDGIDWSDTVAGKCEIVDIKLKRKEENIDYSDFKCNNCVKYNTPVCFVCKLAVSKTGVEHKQRCQVAHCHKYYHVECLDHWPQTQFTSGDRNKKTNELLENLMCPRHVCHTCVSDDPRGCQTRFSGDKLARCVRCPATYHSFTKCLPAGTKILTGSHIICPRHSDHKPGKALCHVNTGWCFLCATGGTLICCEYCPTSFHAECLNIKPPEGSYMCEDCETGRLPLYGEMVWVKLGLYRWWPGIILHPSEIPDNLLAVKHSLGEFVVRFFGQYDHYWVNRGRVFPFQEGDSGRISNQKSKIDADFTTAMEHAYRACEILKNAPPNEEESLDIASSLLPPRYVKLKVNKPCGSLCGRRVDIEESSLTQCECNPDEEDPCGPYSQCLNRMLLTECGPICRAGDRCNNRAFENRLYPKMVPYRTPHRGWGLKTLEDIKAGQFVIEYVGELIDEEEFKRRMNRKHEIRDENFYFLTLDKERMIDAGPKGNLARFMNHSCEPNCETQKWTVLGDVRVGLFAIHDIPANSEVTFNYNLECAGIDKKRCLCGTKRCPGYIGAKPKQDESQPKKPKFAAKRTYKKRKNTEESPSTKNKPKRPVGRPAKPRELTEIEKDLLIIKNATNGLSSDSDCSRLSSVEGDKNQKALKRKRVSFSTEESVVCNSGKSSPIVKKIKLDKDKSESVM